ncbi:hypothetical protein PybrP1_001631 [[Pythium] brassicae (nom. inval.)]|nr:hypothetical protein PybrP1_001631 [[Pythium] brassicae (nom. inval.)]
MHTFADGNDKPATLGRSFELALAKFATMHATTTAHVGNTRYDRDRKKSMATWLPTCRALRQRHTESTFNVCSSCGLISSTCSSSAQTTPFRTLSTVVRKLVPVVDKQDNLHSHPKAPVKGLRKALHQRATVVLVDEFRTSKCCSICAGLLEQLPMRSRHSGCVTSSRQVLRCSTSECRMIWERDVNAARNMWVIEVQLHVGQDRPPSLKHCVDAGNESCPHVANV